MWDSITFWIVAGVVAVAAAVLGGLVARPVIVARKRRRMEKAKRFFHQQRERLEARFVDIAQQSGKPRGLRWSNCDFSDDVSFAYDRENSLLMALVALTISFEAIEGGGMEEVEAVGNLRAATGVFYLEGDRWATKGRVIFNLEPAEAIERFHRVLMPIR